MDKGNPTRVNERATCGKEGTSHLTKLGQTGRERKEVEGKGKGGKREKKEKREALPSL